MALFVKLEALREVRKILDLTRYLQAESRTSPYLLIKIKTKQKIKPTHFGFTLEPKEGNIWRVGRSVRPRKREPLQRGCLDEAQECCCKDGSEGHGWAQTEPE